MLILILNEVFAITIEKKSTKQSLTDWKCKAQVDE